MNFGHRQGRKNDDLTDEEKELTERIFKNHDLNFPGGESVNEMKSRVKEILDEIIESHEDGDTALIIGHGGSLYQILHHILDIFPDNDEWFSNCSYNEIIRNKDSNEWELIVFNGKQIHRS